MPRKQRSKSHNVRFDNELIEWNYFRKLNVCKINKGTGKKKARNFMLTHGMAGALEVKNPNRPNL